MDLTPTTMIIQLTDCYIRRPTDILEDVPTHVCKFVIPCYYIVIGMDDSSQAPINIGRPFPITAKLVIDVWADTMTF